MNARSYVLCAIAPLAVAACTQDRPADRPAPSPAATVIGEGENCIPLAQISTTRIRDDWTIDFIGSGDKVWRNSLQTRCPGLRSDNAITYSTSLTQLCSTDIVYSLRTTAGTPERGAACNLGPFVPVRLEQ